MIVCYDNLSKQYLGCASYYFSNYGFFVCSINNENYIDINDTDYDKRSALHLAACEGHFDAVNYLLKHNAGYIDGKDR